MSMTTTTSSKSGPTAEQTPRRPELRTTLAPIARDIALPLIGYYGLHALGYSDFAALLAGTVLSGSILVYDMIRARRVEAFPAIMLALFGFGLASSLISGDPRMMIVKDSVGTAAIGLALLISALIGKPLIYYAARKTIAARGADALAGFEERVRTIPAVRRSFALLSVLWGVGFWAESAVRVVLAYQLPVHTMVWLSNVLMVAVLVVLIPISIAIGKRNRRR
ncbi:hypothetical protein AWN90_25865 [Nocardia terpenica]|uniref:Intracellular septation protein A n=2 Tax=Nocardia terpenica TaxID=455432 RepID=A0A164NLH9_9NOCA|nr:hypothetical protein AWN90_25865 [Nocardia terpenica]